MFCTPEIDLFEQLEFDIVKYNNFGKVFVSGDFNSRTSDSHDYFDFDKYLDEALYNVNTCSIPNRTNKDRVMDYHGIRLLELCQATGLLIVNGRLFNDMNQGKFTFCSQVGQSTVDYLLTDLSNFDILSFFDVLNFNEFSDHSPVLFRISTEHQRNSTNDIETNNITRKIVWDKTKINEFRSKLMNSHDTFLEQNTDAQNEPVDHVVQSLTRYLHDTAFDVFGKTSCNTNYAPQHKKVRNEWFDETCVNAQQEFKSARNIFNRSKNEETRINFTRARTRFNRIKRKAKQKYKIKEGRRINSMAKSQPKKFWQNIKSTFKKKQERAETLTSDDLHEYFKAMFDENLENDISDQDLNKAETDPNIDPNISNDQLDADFTEEELRRAIFSQKDNKAPGIDCISAEILKSSFDFISDFLLNLYNRMFTSGEYPRSWGEGIITPIFKKGDVNDVSNYRGITLINVLAKVYSQLLLNRLTYWTEMYDKITKSQFGFQKRKSIIDCIFILQSVVSKVLSKGQKLYCVFIDYEKCFDKIDRALLWQKLLSQNVSCKLVRAIKSMYSVVKSCVRYKSCYSTFFSSSVGLKQGDPSSPLLFMLFVNDIVDNINTDLDNIFTINELKLFLISYADDQVIFATSPETLQSLLNDIENYCNLWGLKINTHKTKVMIFEKGRHTRQDFYINNTLIETVESFKYLGITFFKNGNWYRTQKCIAKHSSFALHNLFTIFNTIELPISQKCDLFDTLVASILNFGSEIWGMHDATDIELIHTKFLRRILGVKKCTNLSALYGELGRYPLSVIRKIHMIRYWMKIIRLNDSSLVKQSYLLLKEDADHDNSYSGKNWASQIKSILQQHGFEYVWQLQSDIEIPFHCIKTRIFDIYKQKWYSDINNSSRLRSYCLFKHTFETENYLDFISHNDYKIALSRFRTSSHCLRIESGRYDGTKREERICKSCQMRRIEDEYHFLLVCPTYRELRMKYLKPYYCHWPNIHKFESLMSSSSKKLTLNLAKFIYFATKKRVS